MTPETAAQAAIVALLKADARVSAIVGDQVFDEVPEDDRGASTAAPPYVYLGPVNRRRVEVGGYPCWALTMRWYAVSVDFGRVQAWELADAIGDAMEGQEPALAAPFKIVGPLRVQQAGDVIDPANPKSAFVDVTATVARTARS